jgi:hypothetical protein
MTSTAPGTADDCRLTVLYWCRGHMLWRVNQHPAASPPITTPRQRPAMICLGLSDRNPLFERHVNSLFFGGDRRWKLVMPATRPAQ